MENNTAVYIDRTTWTPTPIKLIIVGGLVLGPPASAHVASERGTAGSERGVAVPSVRRLSVHVYTSDDYVQLLSNACVRLGTCAGLLE